MEMFGETPLEELQSGYSGKVNELQEAFAEKASAGGTMQRTGGTYATAVKVQNPRVPEAKAKQLLAEAKIAGESFFYGWGSGDDRVIGPSIGLAMSAARIWGNCAVEMLPVQDTEDSWIFTAAFIDLETGFTLMRQFRQSKKWTVHGRFDAERKEDMRFQIGQSKAVRNLVTNALPKWLIDRAVRAAQEGVRERIERYIAKNGLPAAVDLVIAGLAKFGVTEAAILTKCEVAERKGMLVDHVVMLRGDLYALEEGQDRAENLFELSGQGQGKVPTVSDLERELAAEDDAAAKRGQDGQLWQDDGAQGPAPEPSDPKQGSGAGAGKKAAK